MFLMFFYPTETLPSGNSNAFFEGVNGYFLELHIMHSTRREIFIQETKNNLKGLLFFHKPSMFKVLGRNDFIDNYSVLLSSSVFKV